MRLLIQLNVVSWLKRKVNMIHRSEMIYANSESKEDVSLFQDGYYLQSLCVTRGDGNFSKFLIGKTSNRLEALKFCKKEAAELVVSAMKLHDNQIWNVVVTAVKNSKND
jgi:hypothetical protein